MTARVSFIGPLPRTGCSLELAAIGLRNGYYNWFKNHGRLTSNPRKGDLVVWGYRGARVSHIGIFRGYNSNGKAMALSALTSGVAVHKVHGINKPFRAYLRVNINRW